MRVRGGVEAVDRLGGERDRGVKSEGNHCAVEIVVDCLRHADDAKAFLGQDRGNAKRAIAADRHQRVDPFCSKHVQKLACAVAFPHRSVGRGDGKPQRVPTICRAENRPAQRRDAANGLAREPNQTAAVELLRDEKAVVAVADADALPAAAESREDHRANDGVEPGRIAAACGDRDFMDHPAILVAFISAPERTS